MGDKLEQIKAGLFSIWQFTYDAAGRQTTKSFSGGSTATFAYDYESRVSSITKSGVTTNTFAYNGLDTRISKTDSTGGPFTYKRAGAGVTAPVLSDGAATYTPGISESRGTSPAVTTYSHTGLKSSETQSSTSQVIGATKNYDAFGNLDSSSGTWKGPFSYGGPFGYQQDPDHGLKLLGHRYYDSSTGRFLTRDPVRDGRNWYTYCANNPLRYSDPLGLKRISDLSHLILDIGGTLEPTPFCDIINSGLHVSDGEWGDAGLTIIGGIPLIGDAGKLFKWGRKGWKFTDEVAEGVATAIDNHHVVPIAFQKELSFYSSIFTETIPVPSILHTGKGGMHSGSGYLQPGGHYNDWWFEKARKVGGPGNVSSEMLVSWRNEMAGYLGF